MYLSWWDIEHRSARCQELVAEGHLDLEALMRERGWEWSTLEAAGLVRLKPVQSTADFVAYEPTASGRRYLKAERAHDLLLVKKGQGAFLVAACQAAKGWPA